MECTPPDVRFDAVSGGRLCLRIYEFTQLRFRLVLTPLTPNDLPIQPPGLRRQTPSTELRFVMLKSTQLSTHAVKSNGFSIHQSTFRTFTSYVYEIKTIPNGRNL